MVYRRAAHDDARCVLLVVERGGEEQAARLEQAAESIALQARKTER